MYINIKGLDQEGIRLILFPFSLKDIARFWYNSMPASSIQTLEVLSSKFLKKLFLAQKTRQMRKEIQSFNREMETCFLKHGDTSMSCFSSVHITTYWMSWYKPFMKV
jgi:hypothetical protein